MTSKPAWLDDTPEIQELLARFLDRLDKQPAAQRRQAVGITLDEKTLPALFSLGEQSDRLWDLLRGLDEAYRVVRIRCRKQQDPFSPEYLKARITLRDEGEAILRDWLNRPRGLSALQAWRQAVAQRADRFPGSVEKLQAYRIVVPGLDDTAVLQGFVEIGHYHRQGLSLRQLSSRCFHGNSKFLDTREDLLRELYPGLKLSPRPVMVNVFLPNTIDGVLFIENQDSYLQAVSGGSPGFVNLALVYVAGFRGSAARIREQGGASLHYQAGSHMSGRNALEAWWFRERPRNWPLWFWGDLDYAGMGILKALKQRFSAVAAWQPGYIPMLALLRDDKGHSAEAAGKQAQTDPGRTGCHYADNILLPAIRRHAAFVDQEMVSRIPDTNACPPEWA